MAESQTKSHLGQLVAWRHMPAKKPKARAFIVHGMGEHSARHLNTVNALLKAGYEVVRFDCRGCGESGGQRQYIDSFEDYVADLVKVYFWALETGEALPNFVVGHSLGGAISIRFAARYSQELTGLCLSAPAFRVGAAVSPLKITVGKMLAGWLPSMKIPKSTDPKAISRDPKVVEAYEKDPLGSRFNTLKQGSEILAAFDTLIDFVPKIQCPTVIFHGTGDKIIRPEGSFEILRTLPGASQKVLHLLPNVYHEPHNDYDKEQYFELLIEWMNHRAPRKVAKKTKAATAEASLNEKT